MKTNNTLGLLKNYKTLTIFIIILSTLFVTNLHADDAILRTVVSKNDLSVGGDFWLDLQIKITNGTSPRTLNSFTADIYYTSTISYDGSAECDWAFTWTSGYSDFTASDLIGYVRLGCTGGNVGQSGADGWNVTTVWQRIVTVKFTITTARNTNISINDNTDAAAYFNNLHNDPAGLVTDWTMSNEDTGDVTLPVVLSAFTAQYINKKAELYWVTESETDNLGWNIYKNYTNDLNSAERINDEFIEGHGTTTEQSQYLYSDNIISPNSGDKFWYWLESIDYSGIINHYDKVVILKIPDQQDPGGGLIPEPERYGLLQNEPNPVITNTKISFNLHETAKVELGIYNLKGQLVKSLYSGIASSKTVNWDGKDDSGNELSAGIYLYKLLVNDKTEETKKLILMQ